MQIPSIMKLVCSIFLVMVVLSGNSQPQLSEIDTVLDYKSRFFRNDTLLAANEYVFWDSTFGWFSTHRPNQIKRLDVSKPHLNGLWIHYYDKKWNDSDSNNFAFYELTQYSFGRWIKKSFTFNKKHELLFSEEPYPIFENEVFNGYLKLSYQNGAVCSAEYKQWEEDIFKNFHFNFTQFYNDGSIRSFSFLDDANYRYRSIINDKSGFCTYDLKLDKDESYRIERKKNGTRIKEIVHIKEDGQGVVIFKKNDEVVRKKQAKGRYRIYDIRGVKWWFW